MAARKGTIGRSAYVPRLPGGETPPLFDLSICIVHYNTPELLRDLLSSICKHTKSISYEIIVVDNGSRRKPPDKIKSLHPYISLIENERNLGFAKANNQAMAMSSGKYIVLLNSDMILKDDALGRMASYLDAHPNVAACGPKLLYPDGGVQFSGKSQPTIKTVFFIGLGLHVLFPSAGVAKDFFLDASSYNGHLSHEVEQIMGAALMVRRQVVEEVGMLDERFFIYCEDVDWCKRIVEKGWRLRFLPGVEMVHYRGESSKQRVFPMIWAYHKSIYLFYKKHFASQYASLLNFPLYICLFMKMFFVMALNIISKEKKVHWGEMKGSRGSPRRRFDLLAHLKRICPAWLLRKILPFDSAIEQFVREALVQMGPGDFLLDAGCGECRFRAFLKRGRYFGVDWRKGDEKWDYSSIDVAADLHMLPFKAGSFDSALSALVIEHLKEPAAALGELARALKPAGNLYIAAPQGWHLHQEPYDYYRFTSYGLRELLSKSGFKVEEMSPAGGYFWYLGNRLLYLMTFFKGWRSIFLPVIGPIFGLALPLICYYLDRLDRERKYTLGYLCKAIKK